MLGAPGGWWLLKAVAACAAVLCFYAFFYRTVVKRWGPLAQWLLSRSGLESRHPVWQVQAMSKLAAAAVAQALFAVVLLLALGARPAMMPGLRPDLIVFGAVLGVGELALSSFLCTVWVNAALLRSPGGAPQAEARWLAQGGGGWMGQFSATVRTAPPWFAAISMGLYVAVEELIFRGILIDLLRPAGVGWAVAVSTALFVLVQAFSMPGLRAAMFPMVGAAVLGLVHGLIYWRVPYLLPLVVGHLAYFGGALGMLSRPEGVPRAA
jgi:hypothetical protein